ncbi:hypothetical protein OSTOST_04251 [Ostertagia ostertagi]
MPITVGCPEDSVSPAIFSTLAVRKRAQSLTCRRKPLCKPSIFERYGSSASSGARIGYAARGECPADAEENQAVAPSPKSREAFADKGKPFAEDVSQLRIATPCGSCASFQTRSVASPKDGHILSPPRTSSERSIRSCQSRCRCRQGELSSSSVSSSQLERCRQKSPQAACSTESLLSAFKEAFKAQSLKAVSNYDGKGSLTDFVRALDVKYPPTVWSDDDRRDILLDHLVGSAKAHVKNLPEEGRILSFNEVVEELRKARDTPCERLKAESEWKSLRKRDGESVFDFCCRLQSIANRMAPKQCLDFQMGSKLYECLAHWSDSYHMLAALDAPEGRIFEEVRKVALRLERTRKPVQLERRKQWSGHREKGEDMPAAGQSHRECPQQNESSAFKSRKNPTRPSVLPTSRPEQRPNRSSFSTKLKSWCYKIGQRRSTVTKAYGEPCYCNIGVFGFETRALIDTGSVVSIIPVGLLKLAQERGVDMDRMVTMLGEPNQNQVLDASGNPMKFLMRIAVEIEVKGAKRAKVQLHVQQSDDTLILLGTNAMKALGIEVNLKPETDLNHETHSTTKKDAVKPIKNEVARARKRVVIPPNSSAFVELEGKGRGPEQIFWSNSSKIASGVCRISKGCGTIPVVNKDVEAWVIPKGHVLGEWSDDPWYDPRMADIPGDMLEMQRGIEMPSRDKAVEVIKMLEDNKRTGEIPEDFKSLIREYSDVFAVSDFQLTQTHLIEYDIDVQGHPPVKQRTRPVPYGIRTQVKEMLQDLEQRNIIEASSSPWASPIVLVAKKDGTIRFDRRSDENDPATIDFRCPGYYMHHNQQLPCAIPRPWATVIPNAPIPDMIHKDATETNVEHPPRAGDEAFNVDRVVKKALKSSILLKPWMVERWSRIRCKRTLVLLPAGFENHTEGFSTDWQVAYSYKEPRDLLRRWFSDELSAIVLFAPTYDSSLLDWTTPWMDMMKCVTEGTDLFLLAGPQDDYEWGAGVDLMRDLAEETVRQRPALRRRIFDLLPRKSSDEGRAPHRILGVRRGIGVPSYTPAQAKRFLNETVICYGLHLRLHPYRRTKEADRRFRQIATEDQRGESREIEQHEEAPSGHHAPHRGQEHRRRRNRERAAAATSRGTREPKGSDLSRMTEDSLAPSRPDMGAKPSQNINIADMADEPQVVPMDTAQEGMHADQEVSHWNKILTELPQIVDKELSANLRNIAERKRQNISDCGSQRNARGYCGGGVNVRKCHSGECTGGDYGDSPTPAGT